MCVGPVHFYGREPMSFQSPLTLLNIKLLLTQLENPQKANSYRAPKVVSIVYIFIYSSLNYLLSKLVLQKKQSLRIENLPKLVRDRVCLIYLTSKNIHFTIQLVH